MKLFLPRLIVHRPVQIIAVVTLLTLLSAVGLWRGLDLDVSPVTFIEKDSRQRADYEAIRQSFGDDQYLIVAVSGSDVFAPAQLAKLRKLHEQISALPGVTEVLSLVNVPYARSVQGGASLERLVPEQADEARLAEARQVATTDRLYLGHFVSADMRTAGISILLDQSLPTVARHNITRQIYDASRAAGFAEVFFAGDPFSQWRGTQAIRRDLTLFLPLTLLLIAGLLWLCFRSWRAVVFPLLSIAIGLIWLLGLMAWFNVRFTIIALMLPTLMLAIGCSYMIHVLNQIGLAECGMRMGEDRTEQADQVSDTDASATVQVPLPAILSSDTRLATGIRQAAEVLQSALSAPHSTIAEALQFISIPVVVSALTIIAGFLSLTLIGVPAVRETAVYAALGAAFTMLLSLTFLPALLVLFRGHDTRIQAGLNGSLAQGLVRVGQWATARQGFLYTITALVIIFSLVGITRIVIDIDYFHFFKPDSETSVGLAEVGKRLAGAATIELIIESETAGAVEKPESLRHIAQLQRMAEGSGLGISHTLSVVDFIRHANRAFHDNDPQAYTIPADPAIVSELLTDRRQVRRFLSEDGRRTRVLVRSLLTGSADMAQSVQELERRGRELLPDFRVYCTGTLVLLNRTSDFIGRDQRNSITLALVTILAVLTILFRSWRMGLTALFPNLIPVLFFFGFMGWRGIPLNLTTSLVASVVLGLAVDNAVQFIVRFRYVLPECASVREAIIESMRRSGRPIIYANIALAAAFAIFAFSTFLPIESFGLLSAATILGCLIEDLVLLPARMTAPVFHEAEQKVESGSAAD